MNGSRKIDIAIRENRQQFVDILARSLERIKIDAKRDDGGQPTGNAGPRISQGTIGIGKAPEPKKKPADAAKDAK